MIHEIGGARVSEKGWREARQCPLGCGRQCAKEPIAEIRSALEREFIVPILVRLNSALARLAAWAARR